MISDCFSTKGLMQISMAMDIHLKEEGAQVRKKGTPLIITIIKT